MSRFGRALRRVDRHLTAPEPERSRILLEVAGDLEELYRRYRERGLDEADAHRKAVERLAPSGPALASLRAVHLPAAERLLTRMSETTRGRVELGLVTLLSLAAAGAGMVGVLRSGTVPATAPGLWIVAGLVACGVGLGLRWSYLLFVRGDRIEAGWRGELGSIAAAAVATAMVGLLAGSVRLSLASAARVDQVGSVPWTEVAAAAGVSALGLCGALLVALLWLLLRTRAASVVSAREQLHEAVGPWEESELEREASP